MLQEAFMLNLNQQKMCSEKNYVTFQKSERLEPDFGSTLKRNLGLNSTCSLYDTQRINKFEKELDDMKICVQQINKLEKTIQDEESRHRYPVA